MHYIDGFVLPVSKRNLQAYRRMAQKASKIWLELGALEFRECVGDDLAVPFGMPFTKQLKTKPGETVMFSWILYKSRKHRDQVNAKIMKDPRIGAMMTGKKMPFDLKRMCSGGFRAIVEGAARPTPPRR